MRDDEILTRISALVDEEHELRNRLTQGEVTTDEEQERIKQLETALDQCWDLLRQRRARRSAGEDPDNAAARPANEVENYRQ
ncbi:DUF2630 family protein [Nonomuraea angiospora]|uniref:Nuclease with TOPRIM domain n=2 Tax=Nonomuraea TaxID=83681 RepID=A0ABR9MET0_9ACTN|nr:MULTISPECIES: DUF2630 family protein [Nonomuraea]MBB5778530.1 putative nuclease with TOPRIM domain [Nonomuraea jabiensis]MBE1591426.1 putative nuclease with TOPRIM domain [Nonomuraea angiospora]MDX3104905.1 DUF2630 family protein [Nonomuraea angiospora]